MSNRIRTIELACGATLVAEPIENVASAAVRWLLPVGSAGEPPSADGEAALLSELIFRGAGGMSSREHSDALDRLGVQRSATVTSHHLRLGATCLGERLHDALDLLGAMVWRPALEGAALDPVRSLCLQSLESLDDDPQHLVMLRLRDRHLPAPFNRHGYGRREVLEQATIEQLREAWSRRCVPEGTIVAVAGAVDPGAVAGTLDRILTRWGGSNPEPSEFAAAVRGRDHLQRDTAQVHLGVAYDAPAEPDRDSMRERLATAVLSGGTSARLFTEVRQRRSLCYSVGASYRAGRDRGMVGLYAGTTPDRAQQTLDVCLSEIERLREGVDAEERERAVTGLRSSLVMQGESTAARASAIASDTFQLGRARSLDELAAAIGAITLDELNDHLRRREFGPFTIASVGPVPVGLPQVTT